MKIDAKAWCSFYGISIESLHKRLLHYPPYPSASLRDSWDVRERSSALFVSVFSSVIWVHDDKLQ